MNNASRIVLVLAGLGLVAMLGSALKYRFTEAHAVIQNAPAPAQRAAAPAAAAQEGAGLEQMQQAMAEDPNRGAMIAAMQRLQADGQDVQALLSLTGLFIVQEDWTRAEDFARRAVVADPGNAQAAYYLGVVLGNAEAYEEAAQSLERSINLQDTPQARFSLGVIWRYHLNDPAKAREQLEKAAASPDITEALRPLVQQELAELNAAPAAQ